MAINGRSELVKTRFDDNEENEIIIFKADQKVQFTTVQLLEKAQRLVIGDTKGNVWLFDYTTGQKLSVVKSHPDRITGLAYKPEDDTIVVCSKDSFLNIFSLQGTDKLTKHQAIKSSALSIVYEVQGSLLLGFNGLNCFLWDAEQDLALIKVNTKGGNRPVRGRYGPIKKGGDP